MWRNVKDVAQHEGADMLIGYGRTSTLEQTAGLAAQAADLTAAGAERIFTEQVSSLALRPQLDAAIDFARQGDVLMVTKLDRLARSTADLLKLVDRLEVKGVGLIVQSMGKGDPLDTRTATGRMMLTVLGAVAEFERNLMLERQRAGIAKAKADGKYKGRKATVRNQSPEILRMRAEGIGPSEIARRLGVNRVSVHRVLVAAKPAPPASKAAV
jgi:DNA invertase Pin-like site-specific DNA recombinase